MNNATFFAQDASSLNPPINLSQFLSEAKQHREKTTIIVDGRLIDEFGRDVTDKKPYPYMKGETLRFAPHLYTVTDIVKDVQSKRETSEDWCSPAKVLDSMKFKLTEALEHLVSDFDYHSHPESKPAHTARILAETLLTLNDFFEKNPPKSSRTYESKGGKA
jgi:hypothetical protein